MILEIKPSNIHFSADIIDNVFHRNSHHCYSRIGETLDSLCEGKIKIRDVPPISVKRYNSGWLTENNRRLWVFRQMERLGKCARIPVVVVNEIAVPTNIAGAEVKVRENPGGIWYLLPSCEMLDPFNIVIWDTAKHIKEFMHPPPSPRMIIKIFQNLSQTRDNGKSFIVHEENSYEDDTCSDVQTFSSDRDDELNNNEVDSSQKEPIDKERRTGEWVLNQTVYITIATQRIELSSQTLNALREDMAKCERMESYHRADQNSEESELSTGYLFVMSDADNTYRNKPSSTDNVETLSVCKGTEHNDKVRNSINLQNEAEPSNINDITNSIINMIQSIFLSRQKTDWEKESELRAYIGDVLQSTAAKHKEKCQMYEREILTLKEDTEKSVAVRQEEIETLKKQIKETERFFQEEMKTMHRKSVCHERANPLQGGNTAGTKENSNETNTEGEYYMYSCHSGKDCQPQDNLDQKTCKRALHGSDTNTFTLETRESDIIQRLKEENRRLKSRNRRLKQDMQKLKVMQNENLYTFAESLFLNTRRRTVSE